MGTLSYSVTKPAKTRGQGGASYLSTDVRTSGVHITSIAASNVEDGAGAISLIRGEMFRGSASENMWINFGGNAATVGGSIFIRVNQTIEVEAHVDGTVSVIDVA